MQAWAFLGSMVLQTKHFPKNIVRHLFKAIVFEENFSKNLTLLLGDFLFLSIKKDNLLLTSHYKSLEKTSATPFLSTNIQKANNMDWLHAEEFLRGFLASYLRVRYESVLEFEMLCLAAKKSCLPYPPFVLS